MTYEKYIGNGGEPPGQSAEVQSDLESIRSEMSETLHEIEERFSVHELTDQLVERVRHAGRGPQDFLRNLGTSLRDHPIPVVLIGAGVTSLLVSEHRESGSGSEGAGEWKERAGDVKARSAEAKQKVSGKVSELRGRTSDLRGRTGEAARRARERGGRILQEQPLVVAGLGLALGAIVGAGAPVSEREQRTIGARGKEIQRAAKSGAEEGNGRERAG